MTEQTAAASVCWCGDEWSQAHADATRHWHDEDMDCCADGPPHPLGEHFPLPHRTHGRAERIRIALTEAGVHPDVLDAAVKAAYGFTREAHFRAWERSRESTRELDAKQLADLTAEAEKLDVRWRHWKYLAVEMEQDRDRLAAELAQLRGGEEPHLDETTVPTPAQWVWRWNRATPERRREVVRNLLDAADRATRCEMDGHEGHQAKVRGLEAERDQLRAELAQLRAERGQQ